MATSQIMGRGAPWAQGRVAALPSGSGVRVFTSKGLGAPGVLGTSPLPQIGTLIPGTPYVYIKPRLSQDDLGAAGGSVFVPYRFPGAPAPFSASAVSGAVHRTNPEFAFYREKRRTPSIGMNRALQTGATMAVSYESTGEPHFSVA